MPTKVRNASCEPSKWRRTRTWTTTCLEIGICREVSLSAKTGPMTVMHCWTCDKLHKLTMNSIGSDNRIDRGVLKEEVSKNVGGICRTPLKLSIVILTECMVMMFTVLLNMLNENRWYLVAEWPGRKLGDLGDVGDLGELSPSYSSPSFRVGPICITRKLGDVWKSFRNFSKLSISHFLSLYSLTACKRISFMV